jgi:CheY-like chemotaxis protein
MRQRIAPYLLKVMVIDPNAASATLQSELMKQAGARHVVTVVRAERALPIANDFDPQLILTELRGEDYDGLEFVRRLRRNRGGGQKAGVIMITSEATAAAIQDARNAGVHEFLRKPFTAGDLYLRVATVCLKPRNWIEAQMYIGPDRRRFNSCTYAGEPKRRSDRLAAQALQQMQRAG